MLKNKRSLVAILIISMILLSNFSTGFINNLKVDILDLLAGRSDNDYYKFVLENVIYENDFSKLERVGNGVYILKSENRSEENSLATEEFKILDTKAEFLKERSFLLVRNIFSQNIKVDSVDLDNFNLEYGTGKIYQETAASTSSVAATKAAPIEAPAPAPELPSGKISEEAVDPSASTEPAPTDTVDLRPSSNSNILTTVETFTPKTEKAEKATSEKDTATIEKPVPEAAIEEKAEKATSEKDTATPEQAASAKESVSEAPPETIIQPSGSSIHSSPQLVIKDTKTRRRPQFIIINNNEIIAGFVIDQTELVSFNTIVIKNISSINDQLLEYEEIDLTNSLPKEIYNEPAINPEVTENDLDSEDPISSKEIQEIEDIKNSKETEINFNEDRKKIITGFVIDNYEKEKYKESFKEIAENIYYFDEKLLGKSSGETLPKKNEQEFFIYEQQEEFIAEKEIYFVNTVFSQKINYNELKMDSFILTDSEDQVQKPKLIFASDYEAIFIFATDHSLNGKLVKMNSINSRKDEAMTLDGFHSLAKVDDAESYLQVKNDVERKYSAYIDKDIVFKTSKISFGKFHSATESDSTIALEIGNTKKLDTKCTILVFGNDLRQKNGTDKMPISGLSLISQSAGDLPINIEIVEKMEKEKEKKFLGFVYFKDLETIKNNKILYLQLSAPEGLSTGAYQSTLSVELFCPEA